MWPLLRHCSSASSVRSILQNLKSAGSMDSITMNLKNGMILTDSSVGKSPSQFLQQVGVGGRKRKLIEFIDRNPTEIRAAQSLRFILFPLATEELQVNHFFGILVSDGFDL